ncbi:DedA family protein [Modestobacter roseus]|uniref:Membrane protein DedA with SNARE-associated domain n=1 Tax=Modestobacter roseus TaxID=1181884 RepID=A0A562IWG5_9ACTN|nr:VTT domain-containing protein [Modestobacter roseus]MQA33400.1 DedA family protein [Modestobacter roseus]TWH75318.1 membrane protein DedA with SNARE-associated domain [Modestobacter roseus]
MTADVLAAGWTDAGSIGYPVVFGGVLLGSIVPVVPTGAVVGAGAAVALTTDHLSLPVVLALAVLGAWLGDVVTFAICRFGGPAAVRWVARGQHAERIAEVREQFRRHGWQIVVVGRLLPAGRIPVLLAAGALAYPWRRLLPASFLAATAWASAYALLGVVSGGIFDSPLVATLIATLLVLAVGLVLNLVSQHRSRAATAPPDQLSAPEAGRGSAPKAGPDAAAPAVCERP